MPRKRFCPEEYDLSQVGGKTIGKGYIFNNTEFEHIESDSASEDCDCKHICDALQSTPLNIPSKGTKEFLPTKRSGSEHDVKTLENVFRLMNLEVIKHEDHTKEEFQETLKTITDTEVKPQDKCIVMAIMTHGYEKRIRLKDAEYDLDTVFETINGCKNLIGKPKIFFIQACRGTADNIPETDAGPDVDCKVDDKTLHGPVAEDPLVVPKGSDFLACFSTIEGYVCYRHPSFGSVFIHQIGVQLKDYLTGDYEHEDFLSLMTVIIKEIAMVNFGEGGKHLKQMPTLVSTLRKKLKFPSATIMQAQSDTVYDDAQVQEEVKVKSQDEKLKQLEDTVAQMQARITKMEQLKSQSEIAPAVCAEKSEHLSKKQRLC